ncbi:MAG TPA: cysteine desulfurase NifS, partial [Firmicutes bacterium]|nr:cysteine desulfurase NifS [Bacillota bacterium]
YGAATPVDPAVLQAIYPFFAEHYGNPNSIHDLGEPPRLALAEAREKVAALLGADPAEIIFTSCASEANNTALKGLAAARKNKGNHIITGAIEHHSVLNPLRTLERAGFKLTILPVDSFGLIDPEQLREAITADTIFISIQAANPEIGTLQPISRLTAVARGRGVPFHTDATAAAGFIPLDVRESGVDLLTLAGDQFYGPKGSAALYLRRGNRLLPFLEGGIQEKGRRAGTENMPAIVGLGEAAALARQRLTQHSSKLTALRDALQEKLFAAVPHLHLNGHPQLRLPHNLHLSVEFVEGEALLIHLNMAGVYVSSGSTCTSQALKSSHVLQAVGLPPELAQGSLLFTLGPESKAEDALYVAEQLSRIAALLRRMSPLYQKFMKEGKR